MSKSNFSYQSDEWIAGHGQVFKHVVLYHTIKQLQLQFPEILLVDCTAGDGVYDLNQHDAPLNYKSGILRLLEKHEADPNSTPEPVQQFIESLYEITGCSTSANLDVYPGSPIINQHLLRSNDEHRVMDKGVEEVQWLSENSEFQTLDAFDLQNLEFILPYTDGGKHPIIVVDPTYEDEADYGKIKKLMAELLDQHPFATIFVWMPLIHSHPFRYSFPNAIKEIAKKNAKKGRFYTNIIIKKDHFQGSAVLICNPSKGLEDVLDDNVIHWLANTMNQGKDEYTIEQIMKKKKQKK